MKISLGTAISFIIAGAILIGGYSLFRIYSDNQDFKTHGKAGVLLPVTEHEEKPFNPGAPEPSYNSTLKVKLDSGEIITIPNMPMTKAQLMDTRRQEIHLRLLPENPRKMRYGESGPSMLKPFLTLLAGLVAGAFWFPFASRKGLL